MSDYSEHLISMAGGDGEPVDAAARVAEWARQWRLNPNIDKSGTIYNVWFDPAASAIELNLNDIEALLALVREQQARIELVRAEADSFDELASHASYNGTEAEMETWLSAATRIRAALDSKP